jgi:hypothetical protein
MSEAVLLSPSMTLAGVAGADALVLVACLALAAGTFIFIFYIDADPGDSAPHRSHLDQLMERRDTIYDNLRDLKFEYRAGKYSEKDFEAMKLALENDAAVVLAEMEQITGGVARLARRTAGAANSTENKPARVRS